MKHTHVHPALATHAHIIHVDLMPEIMFQFFYEKMRNSRKMDFNAEF